MHGIEEKGFLIKKIQLPPEVRELVIQKDYEKLYSVLHKLCLKGGSLFENFKAYKDFAFIETMLSLRSSTNEDEEDGIWHDDGSRVLAFSLSLNLAPKTILGGDLGIRKKGSLSCELISPLEFSEMIIFLTGQNSFEHKVFQVKAGERLVFAGWCS